ncbi:MAG: molybdopterin-guanine dinucleotide biosynthesis protein B [Campylobacteraceae bacterium]|nr:molybdopterin-guanine dinucleotide biosynthesis protein B [Campylobacteraceae bacterium]
MKFQALAFSGPSGSGKTSTIVKIAEKLKQQYTLAIVKHDPSDKAVFDKEGKDSWKFAQTGAEVVVASPTRTTHFLQESMNIEEIIKKLNPFDFLLVEGLKTLPLPRIGIFREKIQEDYLPYCDAIAIKDVDLSQYNLPKNLHVMDLDDIDAQIEWIKKNAKKVR